MPRAGWRINPGNISALSVVLCYLAYINAYVQSRPRLLVRLRPISRFVDAVARTLRTGVFLFRYAGEDDSGRPKTAFLICVFWYIDALAALGRRQEARDLFETVLARRNSLGLLSEDIAPYSGELWGNFPQTYSMVGLINYAMRLSRHWEKAF